MTDLKTIDVYNKRAADYAARFDSDAPDTTLSDFIRSIPQGGCVLDLGCGTGNSAVHMIAGGLKVDAVDASPEMVRTSQEKGVGARLSSFAEIDEQEKFDGVWANFSLLHATREDMPDIFCRIRKALKQNGRLHIGMKTGTGQRRDSLGRFYTYVTESELNELLTSAGFTIAASKTGSEPGLAGIEEPWIIMAAHV